MAVWKDIEPIIDEYERLFEEEAKKEEYRIQQTRQWLASLS
jgi:hypothetical protein